MDQKIIKVEDITDEDVKEFEKYLNEFISVVQNSIGHEEKGVTNFVTGGKTKSVKLPCGLPLHKKYAAARNRMFRFPYIASVDWTNLYYDWKPRYFAEPTLFVTVPGKKIKDSSYEIEDVFNVVGGNNPKNVYFCRASSPVRDIDYRGLLEAIVELSYNTEFEEVDKQMEQAQQTGEYRNPFSLTVLESKNLIFRGAPGTGKSYLAKKIAADIISNGKVDKYEDLTDEQKKQVEFVQFHPSYDYSDFVEGLRPKLNDDGTMGFELRDGIFKEFVARARKNYGDSKKPQETVEDDGSTSDEKTEPKRKDPKKFVFIIDEINRGEISKIFGELFFAIDPSYRGEKGSISTQYANLHTDPSEKFFIPDNVTLSAR